MPTQSALLFRLLFAIPAACAFVGPHAGGFLPASSHQTSTWSNLASSLSTTTAAAAAAEEADGVVEGRRSVKDAHAALSREQAKTKFCATLKSDCRPNEH